VGVGVVLRSRNLRRIPLWIEVEDYLVFVQVWNCCLVYCDTLEVGDEDSFFERLAKIEIMSYWLVNFY
jgi:hypothetical protein